MTMKRKKRKRMNKERRQRRRNFKLRICRMKGGCWMNKGARSLTEKSATGEAFAILAILKIIGHHPVP